MKHLTLLLLFSMMLLPTEARQHEVFTFTAPNGAPLKYDYSVYARAKDEQEWLRLDTYMAKVNAPDHSSKTGHKVSEISYTFFDFNGEVQIKVVTNGKTFATARVRPDSRNITADIINDSTIQFSLSQPENLSVEFDGNISSNLHLFTSRPAAGVAEARREAKRMKRDFVYYKPGLYTEPQITAKSNTTYYLAGGAYFTGTFTIEDAENVSILGRGVTRPADGYEGIHVHRSRNVLIEGVVLNTCPIGGSDGVTLRDIKSISHPQWGDGLNVFASNNVLYDRVFCRNSDDCTTAYATRKGFKGGVRNVHMKNSILWADVAHPIMIGLHGCAEEPDSIVNLTYEDLDILCQSERQTDYQGCLAINCGDNNVVKNVVFDNIRIEQIDRGSLFHVKVCYNDKYGFAPGGNVEDIIFRNISYNGTLPDMSIITGYNNDRKVKNITFEGLKINGKAIHDTMTEKPAWYHTSDYVPCYVGPHVEGVKFLP